MPIDVEIDSIDININAVSPTINIRFYVSGPSNVQLLSFSYELSTNGPPQMGRAMFLGKETIGRPHGSLPAQINGVFELGHLKLNAIEKARKKDIWFRAIAYGNCIAILGKRMIAKGKVDDVKYDYFSRQTGSKRVAESDWVSWLNKWGKPVQQIIIPTEVLKEIEEIKEIQGKDHGETLSKLLEKYKSQKVSLDRVRKAAPIEFVYTEPTRKAFKEKVAEMLDRVQPDEEIRITGYFGSSFLDKILKLFDKGVRVKLITHPIGGLDKESKAATKHLASIDKEFVKVLNIVHSRLFIAGTREAIISSADLKSDSVDTNFEAGIWTNNPIIVNGAIQFFDKIWEEARTWSR